MFCLIVYCFGAKRGFNVHQMVFVGLICLNSPFECQLRSCGFCVFVVSKCFVIGTCAHYVRNLLAFVTLVGEAQVCYFVEDECPVWIIRINQGDLGVF